MPRLVLVRHGATEWSATGQHTSYTDIPLSPEGEAQARHLGDRLRALSISPARVLCSPMQRAWRTAELAGLDASERTDALSEMNYGDYEGLTLAQIRERNPGWDLFRDGCPGGETVEDVAARVARLIDSLSGSGDVLLVAHGHVLRILAAVYLREAPAFARSLPLGTASVSILGHEHEWRAVELWNSTAVG